MITNKGKTIMGKYLLGQAPTYASHIAIGCGAKPKIPAAVIIPIVLTSANISSYQISGNVVTITTTAAHGLLAGNSITVAIGDSRYDGTFTIAVPSSTTFTYTASITIPGTTALSWSTSLATYTTGTTAHSLRVGDRVTTANLGPTAYNNTDLVYSVPSTVTFTMYEASNPGTTGLDQIGTVVLNNPLTIPSNILITQNVTQEAVDTTLATKESLEFEMFRVPIKSRSLISEGGKEYVSFAADLPTVDRFEMTEIGLYTDASNPNTSTPDSHPLFQFYNGENWKYRSATTTTTIQDNIGSMSAAGSIISSASTKKAFYALSSDTLFTFNQRIGTYQKPRYYENFLMVRGDVSDPALALSAQEYIRLDNTFFNLDRNNTADDELRLAFSLIPVSLTATSASISAVNILIRFSSSDTDTDIGQTADLSISVPGSDLTTNGYYKVVKAKLSALTRTSDFSWAAVKSTRVYVTVLNSGGSPTSGYFVALDGLRFENIASTAVNPIYGLTGYAPFGRSTTVTGFGNIVVPITKESNTNSLADYKLGLDLVGG